MMEGAPHIPTERASLAPATQPRILLVDDEPLITRAVERYLRRFLVQADIQIAHDGERALELLPDLKPHVMLLDLVMPRMGGLELARRVSQDPRLGEPAILVLSGSLDPETFAELSDLGVRGCIHKPARSQEILARVLALLPPDQGLVQTG
jgi:CheY-like chemotaxis protein